MAKNESPDAAPIAELEYMPSAFEQALLKHKRKLIMAGILALVGIGAYYVLKVIKEHVETKASLAYTRATSVDDFRKVAKEHRGKPAAASALLMAAQLLADEGKYDQASSELEGLLKEYPDSPLADLATLRLAEASLKKGAKDQGKTLLQKVADSFQKSPYAPLAMFRLGDLYAADKNVEDAKKCYEAVKKRWSGNMYISRAEDRVKNLGKPEPTLIPFVEEKPELPPATSAVPNPTPPSTEIKTPGLSLESSSSGDGKPMLETPNIKLESPATPSATPPTGDAPKPEAPKPDAPKPEGARPAPATPATNPPPAAPAAPATPKPDGAKPATPTPATPPAPAKPASPNPAKPAKPAKP